MSYIVAIVGSYHKHGTVDLATDALLASAEQLGAHVCRINLLDKRLEFCSNCRSCTQDPGPFRGRCLQRDDLSSILCEIDAADVLVLAAPVNFFNVTALFRRFMERLVGYAYWPWGDGVRSIGKRSQANAPW
jgi:multimeric flavodoxin WrbA